MARDEDEKGQLSFRFSACGKVERPIVLTDHSTIVLSGIRRSCYRVAKPPLYHCRKTNPGSLKLYSKIDSKIIRASLVDNASPEASQRRHDARAFGDGTGAGSTPARSEPSTPSSRLVSTPQTFHRPTGVMCKPSARATTRMETARGSALRATGNAGGVRLCLLRHRRSVASGADLRRSLSGRRLEQNASPLLDARQPPGGEGVRPWTIISSRRAGRWILCVASRSGIEGAAFPVALFGLILCASMIACEDAKADVGMSQPARKK